MKKTIGPILAAVLCLGAIPYSANAELVTGQAYIENGNIQKAKLDAKRDAMRTFVEKEVGVHIKASSEAVNSLLVRDSIIAKDNGYVLVKKVVDEKEEGELYTVILDLEADKKQIQTQEADVRDRLMNIDETSSRYGLNVAIVDEDASQTAFWNDYFTGMLKMTGFRSQVNDDVVAYLGQNINRQDDLTLNAEIRRMGRLGDRMDANAIIRGRIRLARPAEKIKSRAYRAVAQVNCELIGYDANAVDVAAGYYTQVADTPEKAEQLAKEAALQAAAKKLGSEALNTVQQEFRDGIKMTFVFQPITDKMTQRRKILDGLTNANCEIIRSSFVRGTLQVYISSAEYNSLEELKEAVIRQLMPSFPQLTEADDGGQYGSTKLIFNI